MHTETTRARTRTAGALLATAIAAAMVLFGATPASALWDPDPVLPRAGFFTQVTITGSQYPTNVTGELTTLAPTPGAYPATGASVEAVSPQLITIADPVSGATASAYCIDFSTETGIGAGYNIGEWDASNVPNLDYINYILNNYFPFNTANPLSGLPLSQQVAAVQSTIWYFSDGFVLATGTNATIRNATAAVVQAALDSGGLPEPALPTLAIDPTPPRCPRTDRSWDLSRSPEPPAARSTRPWAWRSSWIRREPSLFPSAPRSLPARSSGRGGPGRLRR